MTQIMRDIAFNFCREFAVSNFQKVRKCSKNGLNQGFFEVAFWFIFQIFLFTLSKANLFILFISAFLL